MKNFCSAQDIEELAAQGKTELIIDENTVLTDLARHTAHQLGISLVNRSRTTPPATLPSPAPISRPVPRAAGARLGNKPKGCQHGLLPSSQNSDPIAGSNTTANTVVEQLVGLVKRLGGKGPAN